MKNFIKKIFNYFKRKYLLHLRNSGSNKFYKKGLKWGYYEEDTNIHNNITSYEPIKCVNCGSEHYQDVNHDFIAHRVTEFERICGDCFKEMGYWAYGSWMND